MTANKISFKDTSCRCNEPTSHVDLHIHVPTRDEELAASELRGLGPDQCQHYFVKKFISMAMDRHDREKEMVSVLDDASRVYKRSDYSYTRCH